MEEIEGFLIGDEKEFESEEVVGLIKRIKDFAQLGKEGRVLILDKNLSIINKLKLILIVRYLGEKLSSLKPELEISSNPSVSTKEISQFLGIEENNVRVRMSSLTDEGFARRPETGRIQVNFSKIENFIASLESGNSIQRDNPGSVSRGRKIQKRTEKFEVNEEELFMRLSKTLEVEEEVLKRVFFIMKSGLFKFNKTPKDLKSKHSQQKFVILTSAYILLHAYNKKTFNTGTISNICYNSYVDNSNIKDAIKDLKRKRLISSTARATQENMLMEEGKKVAKELLLSFLNES